MRVLLLSPYDAHSHRRWRMCRRWGTAIAEHLKALCARYYNDDLPPPALLHLSWSSLAAAYEEEINSLG